MLMVTYLAAESCRNKRNAGHKTLRLSFIGVAEVKLACGTHHKTHNRCVGACDKPIGRSRVRTGIGYWVVLGYFLVLGIGVAAPNTKKTVSNMKNQRIFEKN